MQSQLIPYRCVPELHVSSRTFRPLDDASLRLCDPVRYILNWGAGRGADVCLIGIWLYSVQAGRMPGIYLKRSFCWVIGGERILGFPRQLLAGHPGKTKFLQLAIIVTTHRYTKGRYTHRSWTHRPRDALSKGRCIPGRIIQGTERAIFFQGNIGRDTSNLPSGLNYLTKSYIATSKEDFMRKNCVYS